MGDVSVATQDGVAVASIERAAKANALRRETIADLHQALAQAEQDGLRALVLTGSGGRFSAGADLEHLSGTIDDLGFDDDLEAFTAAIGMSPVVVIAAVEGFCFGAAVDLAWSCDAVAVASNTRIALPATRIGLLYNPISLKRLHARLGSSVVRRLVVVGEELSGTVVGATGAAIAVEPGSAVQTAVGLGRGVGADDATTSTKAAFAALDSGDFDPRAWQTVREELLSSPSRLDALNKRKTDVKGTT